MTITCPTTGATWPDEWFTALRTCTGCAGLIDVRHMAWYDDPVGGPWHVQCPTVRT